MKRIIICLALLTLVVTISVYSRIRVEKVTGRIDYIIDSFEEPLLYKKDARLIELSKELSVYWDYEEDTLAHYVRHNHLDSITQSVSRLPSYAAYSSYNELSAELATIRRLIEYIRLGEKFSFKYVL